MALVEGDQRNSRMMVFRQAVLVFRFTFFRVFPFSERPLLNVFKHLDSVLWTASCVKLGPGSKNRRSRPSERPRGI